MPHLAHDRRCSSGKAPLMAARSDEQPLPILQRREEIVRAVTSSQVVVVSGATGSGKTTQLPQFCHAMGLSRAGIIGHTQPRRIAARAVASRIAEEMNQRLGGLVGFKVRQQDVTSRDTAIKVMTDGVLLAELSSDPLLSSYSVIIVDEAHERSLNVDFLLGCLRRILPKRPELRVIVTSATIDTAWFAAYFGLSTPVIEVSGRTFPVEVRYRPCADDDEAPDRVEAEAIADALDDLVRPRTPPGDILVFLPGEREIRLAAEAARRRGIDAEVLMLISRMSSEEQDRVFHPGGRRRVILATNVAETSLTVPGIVYVVDTGLARVARYDPARKIGRLPIEPISRASADQRAGRCGRISPGVCVRLYSQAQYQSRPAFTDPEIRRSSLASVILQMKADDLGAVEEFPFLDPPPPDSVRDGYETLFELGAIDAPAREGSLTEVGRRLARLPVDPRIGRMLLGAQHENSLRDVAVLAAALSIQDPRNRPPGRQEEADRAQGVFRDDASDFLTLLKLWDQASHARKTMGEGEYQRWCRDHFLSAPRLREWAETHRQLCEVAESMGMRPGEAEARPDAVHRALLTGLITNVACREGAGGSFDYRGVRGNVVSLFPGSVLFRKSPKWIMAAEIVQTSRVYARTVARVEPEWVEELAGHVFQHQISDKHFDPETGRACAWERLSMSGVVVVPRRRTPLAPLDPDGAREIFIREGLAQQRWRPDLPFQEHNRRVLEEARSAEARLRRHDVLINEASLASWFADRVPDNVRDPESFMRWWGSVNDRGVLDLHASDIIRSDAMAALDSKAFPSHVTFASSNAEPVGVTYAFSPGKDADGITFSVRLADLPDLDPHRLAWLVPGVLPQLVLAMLKLLPKGLGAELAAAAPAPQMADECAKVMDFGVGHPASALSEAIEGLYARRIPPASFPLQGLPAHLRPRVRVLDDDGSELGSDRDLAKLQDRFRVKAERARAKAARARFERPGLTSWDFDSLPGVVMHDVAGVPTPGYPMLVDQRTHVSLTLADRVEIAGVNTPRGVRRLLALACREEVAHHLEANGHWEELCRQYAGLGPRAELLDEATCLVAERTFIVGQSPIAIKADFETRLHEQWGRLGASSREVCDLLAGILEPRAAIARRFSGGTPRLWAASVADLREQAAYLMPHGFLLLVGWERLRRYPVYTGVMRERLFSLREEGFSSETPKLNAVAPRWKPFTAWVVRAMARAREHAEAPPGQPSASSPGHKAPLPQARRAAPAVNLDAGAWAMQPGNLPLLVGEYRWLAEEFRAAIFSGDQPRAQALDAQLTSLWARVQRECP